MYTDSRFNFLFTIFLGITSCGENQTSNKIDNDENHHEEITLKDAKEFLPDWSAENTLVVMLQSDPVNLHPATQVSVSSLAILNLMHAYLLMVDQQHPKLIPSLVKALPRISDDQLQYTYELLNEAQWDDGSPVTSEDVIFTLKVNKCPLIPNATIKSYVSNLQTIKADTSNSRKFTLVMKSPYVSNMGFVTNFYILSRKFYDPQNILSGYTLQQFDDSSFQAGNDLDKWSVEFNNGRYGNDPEYFYGAGPYRVISWDHGTGLVLQRKLNHWTQHLKEPNIYQNSFPDKIIFKVVKDENAQVLEFKAQTLDATNILTTKALLDLRKDSMFNRNYNSAFIENYGLNYIAFNTRPDGVTHKIIFDDLNVRKAFAFMTPVDQIISVAVLGKAIRWPSMVSPLRPEFNNDLALIPYDVTRAKELLDVAGWQDSDGDGIRDKLIDGEKVPLEVTFSYFNQSNSTRNIANMIVESASQAGVKIIPQPFDVSALQQKAKNHDFDMLMLGWSTSALQEDYTQLWHTSSWTGKGSNFSGFGNSQSDALIDSLKHTLNDSLRHEMSKRIQKMVYDEQPYVFLYSTYRKMAIHKRWGNQIMTAESPCLILGNLKLLAPSTGVTVIK